MTGPAGRWPRYRLPLVIAVAVAVVAVVLVRADRADDPAADVPAPRSDLPPVRLADQPLWTSEPGVESVDVGAGVLLLHQGYRLTLVDAATGTARWTRTSAQDLTGDGAALRLDPDVDLLVGQDVVVGWENAATGEAGVALLSGVDGHVGWRTTTVAAGTAPRPAQRVRVVTDDLALVSVGDPRVAPPRRTIALDVRTGAVRWENTEDWWPAMATTDAILGSTGLPGRPEVMAVDQKTGATKWTGVDGLEQTEVVMVAGAGALVRGVALDPPAGQRYVGIDGGTGREIVTLGTVGLDQHPSCGGDHAVLIVCAFADPGQPSVAVFLRTDVETGVSAVVDEVPGPVTLEAVYAGRALLSDRGDDGAFTIDTRGRPVDRGVRLPGRLVDLTDDRAVVRTGEGTVAVYPVVSG